MLWHNCVDIFFFFLVGFVGVGRRYSWELGCFFLSFGQRQLHEMKRICLRLHMYTCVTTDGTEYFKYFSIKVNWSYSPYSGLSTLSMALQPFVSKPLLPGLVPQKQTCIQQSFHYKKSWLDRHFSKWKERINGEKRFFLSKEKAWIRWHRN